LATIKLSAAKSAGAAISYAEGKNHMAEETKDWLRQKGVSDTLVERLNDRAVAVGGENIDLEHVRGQMRATRELFRKNGGVQAHRVIQSFSAEDLNAANPNDWQRANDLGVELGRRIAPNHEIVVYTHVDGEGHKLHNHIIINAPNLLTGVKYHEHNDFDRVTQINDQLVQENGLSVVHTTQHERQTIAERHLKSTSYVWKDDLRRRIDKSMQDTRTIDFKHLSEVLFENGVNINVRGKNVSYAFLDTDGKQRAARGIKLGASYEKEVIFDELARRAKQLGQINQRTANAAERIPERNQATEQIDQVTQTKQSSVTDRINNTIGISDRIQQSAHRGIDAFTSRINQIRERIKALTDRLTERLVNRLAIQAKATEFQRDMNKLKTQQKAHQTSITKQKTQQRNHDQGLSL
jgi:hypothetical protein